MNSIEKISFKNFNELIYLEFNCFCQTTFRIVNKLKFSKVDESLIISFVSKQESFDSDFIYHLFKQINKLMISGANNDNIVKLLSDKDFPNLKELEISLCDISRIESKMFNGSFPMLQTLAIYFNKYLEKIDHDAFSNLKQLTRLSVFFIKYTVVQKLYKIYNAYIYEVIYRLTLLLS